MKKFVLFLLLPFIAPLVKAQNALTITPGTDLYISSSDLLNIEGLSLTPSAPFTISGASVAKNNSVTNTGLSNTVARAYLLSTTSAPFSGVIRVYYSDAELGSLNENSLQVQAHTGSEWQTLGATSRNTSDNYVEVTGVTNRAFTEIALNVNTLLPLTWKQVMAQRQQQGTIVQWTTSQEMNISNFSVERKIINKDWQIIGDGIKPLNNTMDGQYTYTDFFAPTERIEYRIRQTDRDGRYTYSPVVVVAAIEAVSLVRLYPNPAGGTFSLQLNQPINIKELQLYHSSGTLVEKWQVPQSSYSIGRLPSGVYQLCILETNGHKHYIPLIKN